MRDEFMKGFAWCEVPKVNAQIEQFDELLDKEGPVERILNGAIKATNESNVKPLVSKAQIEEHSKEFFVLGYFINNFRKSLINSLSLLRK